MPVSPSTAFTDALRYGSTLVTTRMTLYQAGAATTYLVPTSTANITVDRNSNYRRSGQVTVELPATVPPNELLPIGPHSLLAPFGAEVYLEFGLNTGALRLYSSASWGDQEIEVYDSGAVQSGDTIVVGTGPNAQTLTALAVKGTTTPFSIVLGTPLQSSWASGTKVQRQEFYPIGLLDIATTAIDDTVNDLTVTIDVYDRSWVISQRKLRKPYNIPASDGTFYGELTALLNSVWGSPLSYNVDASVAGTAVPSGSYGQNTDPWVDIALQMASSVGAELYFDTAGGVVARPMPDPTKASVVWNFTDDKTAIYGGPGQGSAGLLGSPYSTPVECQSQMTRDGIYNDIWVTGSGTPLTPGSGQTNTAPIQAEAPDNNPSSATYVGGRMGYVPNFVSSNLVLTDAQALSYANNQLQIALSNAWQVTLSIPPTPFLDVDDVVTITRPRVFGLNNPKTVVIDQITHSLRYADLSQLSGRVIG